MSEQPYNPLDKRHLGESVADAILQRPITPLPPAEAFVGAGIYAIYYTGNFRGYEPLAKRNRENRYSWPIYVGKAVPVGARKGGFGLGINPGRVMYMRLREHAESIEQAKNLNLGDFTCRYLVVDDIWIPLGESLLIEKFSPVWNRALDGFGNHDPGTRRATQYRSPWDVVHPGRPWVEKLAKHPKADTELLAAVREYLKETEKILGPCP
ncbi:MAG: Eco29kI family restriction endonuclease [Candidatus Methylomirabilis oxygeniifera]|nr:MAG: Eco29kI family restriction endonuclease [Candidatus Methylomirabilis oxyfera]